MTIAVILGGIVSFAVLEFAKSLTSVVRQTLLVALLVDLVIQAMGSV